jgi:hypothetical protein
LLLLLFIARQLRQCCSHTQSLHEGPAACRKHQAWQHVVHGSAGIEMQILHKRPVHHLFDASSSWPRKSSASLFSLRLLPPVVFTLGAGWSALASCGSEQMKTSSPRLFKRALCVISRRF